MFPHRRMKHFFRPIIYQYQSSHPTHDVYDESGVTCAVAKGEQSASSFGRLEDLPETA